MNKYLMILTLLILAGCETTDLTISEHTLAGNPRIPHRVIDDFYEGEKWNKVKNLPYDAYVILYGGVKKDHTVEINETVESYPNSSWVQKAKKFAKEVRLSPTNVGSRTPPMAEVFVVFYETGLYPKEAMVFARQKGASAQASFGGNKYFITWTYND